MSITIAVLNIAWLYFIAFSIWKKEQVFLKKYFWPTLLLKLVAGICVGLVYTYYYASGDTFGFFYDATHLTTLARNDLPGYIHFLWTSDQSCDIFNKLIFTEERSLFFVKILSVVNLLTNDNYWISSLYFSFASFAGSWLVMKRVAELRPAASGAAIISFLLLPSAIFWSSGIIKESIAMAALFYLSAVFVKVWMKKRSGVSEGLMVIMAGWVLWNLKYYYLAIFLPVVITVLLSGFIIQSFRVKNFVYECMISFSIFIIPLFLISFIHPNFYLDRFMEVVVQSNEAFTTISDPGDVIHYKDLRPVPMSILFNSPWALFSGLYRPFLLEADTFFQLLVSLENLVLLLMSAFALIRLRYMSMAPNRIISLGIMVYVLLLCVFLALSTPNFGTLARYRVAYYPFFVFLVINDNPLTAKWNKLWQSFFSYLASKR